MAMLRWPIAQMPAAVGTEHRGLDGKPRDPGPHDGTRRCEEPQESGGRERHSPTECGPDDR